MYENCITLARQHTNEITTTAARLICEKKTPQYSQLSPLILNQQLSPTLQMQLRYLETSNLDEWKTYCIRDVTQRMAEGVDYASVIMVVQCLVESLNQFFKTALPPLETIDDLPVDKILTSLNRRLMGLNSVAASAIMTIGLKSTRN